MSNIPVSEVSPSKQRVGKSPAPSEEPELPAALPKAKRRAADISDAPLVHRLTELALRYRDQLQLYIPRFRAYARRSQQLKGRFEVAGNQLKQQLLSDIWMLDQQRSLSILILPVEAGLLLSRHLLAFLEDLLSVSEHRLGLREQDRLNGQALPIMAMTAKPGDKVESMFLIQNDHPQPVNIAFNQQALVGRKTGPSEACDIIFEPGVITLPAGSNQMIRLTAHVGEAVADDIYLARVDIEGLENKAFCLQVQVSR